MIHVGPFQFLLPPFLQSLPQPLIWSVATLAAWLGVALLLQFVIFRLIKALARRTETDIEDVFIDITRRPLILIILLLGAVSSLRAAGAESGFAESLSRYLLAAVMAVTAYWTWRLLKEIVIHYGEQVARRSETRLDDVLLPIVNQFAPLAIALVATAVILQYLGVRLDALLVAIGGAAFILAFALQDILSNIFSGMSLLVDTPFRYGDLIMLEDGKVCQVVKIGVRVTQLYDIDTHSVIFMPNSKLANERLANLMQPSAESISVVPLLLHRETDVEQARQVLGDILDGHPDLLGEVHAKLASVDHFGVLSAAKRAHGLRRLEAEERVNQALRTCGRGLDELAAQVTRQEKRGFDRREREELSTASAHLSEQIGEVTDVEDRLNDWKGPLEGFLDEVVPTLPPESLARRTWEWVNIWAEDPDLEVGVDDLRLKARWSDRLLALLRRMDELHRRFDRPESLDQRLDDATRVLGRWLTTEFKQPVPPWKCSGASFKGFRDGGLAFNLFFFVDNIELEHFFRQARVETEVRREAARRLKAEGIGFASQRQEIEMLRDGRGESIGLTRAGSPAAQDAQAT
jgi:MscS family membrane protein